jgi:hypothetical protein
MVRSATSRQRLRCPARVSNHEAPGAVAMIQVWDHASLAKVLYHLLRSEPKLAFNAEI